MATDDSAIAIRTADATDNEVVVDLLHSYVAEANPQLLALTGRTIVPTDRDDVHRWVTASRAQHSTILLAIRRGSPIGPDLAAVRTRCSRDQLRIYVALRHPGQVRAQLLDALIDRRPPTPRWTDPTDANRTHETDES